jgi:purine-nucleoside phosphorylase
VAAITPSTTHPTSSVSIRSGQRFSPEQRRDSRRNWPAISEAHQPPLDAVQARNPRELPTVPGDVLFAAANAGFFNRFQSIRIEHRPGHEHPLSPFRANGDDSQAGLPENGLGCWRTMFKLAAMDSSNPLAAAARLKKVSSLRPTLALVLGSGFHHALAGLRVDKKLACAKIPGFPEPTVSGHAGEIYFGHLGRTPVLVLSGRAHFYEGHSMERVTFAIRALAAFGIRDLLLTNAAGGVNKKFRAGDFMVLTDHINFMGANPLRGPAIPGLMRFVDLTDTYDVRLRELLCRAGKISGLKLQRGVYLAVSGPSYETPAEIRAFARLGADAVGMSTVPEAIAARQCGLRVAAVSCITNLAAGISPEKLSHAEVLATAERVRKSGAALIKNFAVLYGK